MSVLLTQYSGLVEDVATAISLYNVRAVTSEASQRVQQAVELLADMKRASEILKIREDVDQLESDANRVLRLAMSKLFREEHDVKTLIKLKAIYELLETITDKCEDVANIIECIVLENA
ncbi:Phosphate transport regulator [Candidatus Burkholderia brachyanthoides]|nr:Phosphate transport regulator [Candidatus Burkholderia brachyanthoides]